MGKKKKKKDVTKKVEENKYPSGVDERVKKAMALEPPDKNEWKVESEDNIDKFGRYRVKYFQDYENLKQKSRFEHKR